MSRIDLDATSTFPSLTVNDVATSLTFYTEGLGFAVADRVEEDGTLRFVMLTSGTCRLGIGQDDWAKGRGRVKGVGVRIWLETAQDIHALATQAKAAGIELDHEPEPLPWGPMAFALKDPDGFLLTVANPRG